MLQYETTSFPSWRGQSASFSVWIRPDLTGYVLGKSPDAAQNELCWSLFVSEAYGIGTFGAAMSADGSWMYPSNILRWGGSLEASGAVEAPIRDKAKKLRHVAWVFDQDSNSLRAYLDGTLVQEQAFQDPGTVARLDCDATPSAYLGLGHRAPGGMPTFGDYQDFRMYVGAALTDAEVKGLAAGEGSIARRECSLATEGEDSNFKDMNGMPCAWYQEAMSETEAVCTAESVRKECPVACATQEPCFEQASAEPPTFQIWERIMRLQPKVEGYGSLCVREGLDPVDACWAAQIRRDPRVFPEDGHWSDSYLHWGEGGLQEWDVANCVYLRAMIDDSCSFKVPGGWTQTFDEEVRASREWTISFWYKVSKDATQLGDGFDAWMTFYSSVSPPIPLLRVIKYYDIIGFQLWGRPGCDAWEEDTGMSTAFDAGKWVHIAMTFGARRGEEGQRYLQIVKDSEYGIDLINREWCPPSSGEFIQAISVLSFEHEVLLSPISVTSRALSIKALQRQYYQLRPAFRWRRGPDRPESSRTSLPVSYKRAAFDAAGALMAPPILLQRRLESEACGTRAGSDFKDKVWRDAVEGMTCGEPYECAEDLLNSSSALLRCKGEEPSAVFLGRLPLTVGGEAVFAEFLPSIADASILVRGGALFETSTFIDTQTHAVSLPLLLFAPSSGVLTLISVEASFSSRVYVDYKVQQFQSVEGPTLHAFERQAAITFALIALGVLELLWQASSLWRQHQRAQLKFVLLDLLVLVVMPLLFLAARLRQLRASARVLSRATGEHGLGGVPWASTQLALEKKMDAFFVGLEEVQEHIAREQRMRVLGFLAAVLLLLRLISATKAHPRTAILVRTIVNAADDLWHFILLFLVLFLGFGGVAHVSFGMRTAEFHSLAATFETLFDMMLGSLPKHGGGGAKSQSWTADPLMIIFVSLFNFLVFFVLLNFIIAIIVESYLATKARLEEEVTEQEFLHDIAASVRALCKRAWFRWPSHLLLAAALEDVQEENIGTESFLAIFSSWDRSSVEAFVAHYKEFGFLDPKEIEPPTSEVVSADHDHHATKATLEGAELVSEIVKQVEERLLAILGNAEHPAIAAQMGAMGQSWVVSAPRGAAKADAEAPKDSDPSSRHAAGTLVLAGGDDTETMISEFELPNTAQPRAGPDGQM